MKNDDEEDGDNLTNTFVFNYNTHTHSHREWRPRVTQQWGRLRRRSMYMYTRNWSIKLFYWRSCLAVAVSRPAPRLTEKLFFFGFFFASLSVHWVRLVTTLALLFRHCVYCAQLNDEHFLQRRRRWHRHKSALDARGVHLQRQWALKRRKTGKNRK